MSPSQLPAFNKEITPEEEKSLWDSYLKAPDDADIHIRLVELYLPIVAKVANKVSYNIQQKIPLEELLSAGVVGLHNAISNFSPGKKILFTTYAYKRIHGAILDELRSQDPLTRTQRNYYREICEAINLLTAELGRPPGDDEIAKHVGLSASEVDKYIGMGSNTINLDEEFHSGLKYMDVLADESTMSPRESVHRKLAMENIREHFRALDEREQKLLFLRHYEEMSVKEIAKVMEISEGRISQIYSKIILKLRALIQHS